MISCSDKALMTFHHDAPNNQVPDINFVEFLDLQSMPVKVILYLQKIPSIYC